MAEKNSDGSWSDYIFANGQRIAEADSYDERIHTHGTSSGTGEYASWHLPFDGYVVKSGDKISWRQYQAGGGDGGVLLGFTDSTTANWTTRVAHTSRYRAEGTDTLFSLVWGYGM